MDVLVVDDDDMMCEYTVSNLKALGINAEWVDNGKAVEKVIRAHDEKDFDIVILDWMMPDQDGWNGKNQGFNRWWYSYFDCFRIWLEWK